jgi:hypothetical protein
VAWSTSRGISNVTVDDLTSPLDESRGFFLTEK